MPPEVRKLLRDALDAASGIQNFTKGKTFGDFAADPVLRSAVYWQFAIIGEALSKLGKLDEDTFDRIAESPRIVSFRNQILHGYQVIQDNITWQIVKDKVPVLHAELTALLAE